MRKFIFSLLVITLGLLFSTIQGKADCDQGCSCSQVNNTNWPNPVYVPTGQADCWCEVSYSLEQCVCAGTTYYHISITGMQKMGTCTLTDVQLLSSVYRSLLIYASNMFSISLNDYWVRLSAPCFSGWDPISGVMLTGNCSGCCYIDYHMNYNTGTQMLSVVTKNPPVSNCGGVTGCNSVCASALVPIGPISMQTSDYINCSNDDCPNATPWIYHHFEPGQDWVFGACDRTDCHYWATFESRQCNGITQYRLISITISADCNPVPPITDFIKSAIKRRLRLACDQVKGTTIDIYVQNCWKKTNNLISPCTFNECCKWEYNLNCLDDKVISSSGPNPGSSDICTAPCVSICGPLGPMYLSPGTLLPNNQQPKIGVHEGGSTGIKGGSNSYAKPNPNNGSFEIFFADQTSGKALLQIFDNLGNVVDAIPMTKENEEINWQVDISNMPNGVYHYSILIDDLLRSTGKIVVTH